MTVSLAEFLPEFKRLHGIFVMGKTYEGTCAFLDGFEVGAARSILTDFNHWLGERGRGPRNVYWPILVLYEIYEDGNIPDIRYLTPEEDERATSVLFDLLEEYFRDIESGKWKAMEHSVRFPISKEPKN